jgi:hypothetical protein
MAVILRMSRNSMFDGCNEIRDLGQRPTLVRKALHLWASKLSRICGQGFGPQILLFMQLPQGWIYSQPVGES